MRLISLGSILSVAVLAMVACTSGGEETTPGDGDGDGDGDMGTGGSGTPSGGSTGDGDGDGDGDGEPGAVACLPATEAAFLDFTYDLGMGGATPSPSEGSFGDYSTVFSGGTFVYPLSASGNGDDGITSDVTGDNWHISGSANDYAGFGLFFATCTKLDASAYSGLRFTISGDSGIGPIRLTVGTAANEITSAWLNENTTPATPVAPNFGRCTPTATQYDGSCAAPSVEIPALTGSPQVVEIQWADLVGGSPAPTVDPSEITFISWVLTAPVGAGTAEVTPYDVDITVDDIGFIE